MLSLLFVVIYAAALVMAAAVTVWALVVDLVELGME